MTKEQVGKEKGAFGLYFKIMVRQWRKSGQELKQGRNLEADAMQGVLLLGLLPLACSACFLIEPRAARPGMATPTRGWALPP